MIERYTSDIDNSIGFTKKGIASKEYIVDFDYICQICFRKIPAGPPGHMHVPKKCKDKQKKLREQQRESYLRLRERRRLLKSC